MKTLVVYDSQFGNTEKIAKAIGSVIGSQKDVKIVRVTDADSETVKSYDLLVVGSPTQGGRPTDAIANFVGSLWGDSLKRARVAAYDTRFEEAYQGLALKMLMGILGYAAGKINDTLARKGAVPAVQPEGFFVVGKEGPLKDGELERAKSWAKKIVQKQQGSEDSLRK